MPVVPAPAPSALAALARRRGRERLEDDRVASLRLHHCRLNAG
jgi:hypothetical protein